MHECVCGYISGSDSLSHCPLLGVFIYVRAQALVLMRECWHRISAHFAASLVLIAISFLWQ